MKLSITGWSSKGLRMPDMEFTCQNGKAHNRVVLCQVPNGTGKTTMINLIISALSNRLVLEDDEEVASYASIDGEPGEGFFELFMRYKEGRSKEKDFKIKIDFDFQAFTHKNAVTFSTYTETDGYRTGVWDPPIEIIRFLDQRTVNLFCITGENTLQDQEPHAAIDALCGLNSIDDIRADLNNFFEHKMDLIQESIRGTIRENQGFSRRRNNLKKAEVRLGIIKEDQALCKKKKAKLKRDVDKLENKIKKDKDFNKKLTADIIKCELQLVKDNSDLEKKADELFDLMRNPAFLSPELSTSLVIFKDRLARLKLPENVGRAWFNDLLKEENCICDRPMDKKAKKSIQQKKEELLEGAYQTTLGTFKSNSEKLLQAAKDKSKIIETFKQAKKKADETLKKSKVLKTRSEQSQNKKIQALMKDQKVKERKIGRLEGFLKAYRDKAEVGEVDRIVTQSNFSDIESQDVMEKVVNKLKAEVFALKESRKLKEKKEAFEQKLKQVKDIARDSIKEEMKDEINDKLKTIYSDDKSFRLASIASDRFKISNKRGMGLAQSQKRILSYIFVTSLLKRSNNTFPMVVDHPTAALDNKRRREFAKHATKVIDQLIFFIIDNEKDAFVDQIESNPETKNGICYSTIFKNEDTEDYKQAIKDLPSDKSKISKSHNGIICYSKEYFQNFTIEGKEHG